MLALSKIVWSPLLRLPISHKTILKTRDMMTDIFGRRLYASLALWQLSYFLFISEYSTDMDDFHLPIMSRMTILYLLIHQMFPSWIFLFNTMFGSSVQGLGFTYTAYNTYSTLPETFFYLEIRKKWINSREKYEGPMRLAWGSLEDELKFMGIVSQSWGESKDKCVTVSTRKCRKTAVEALRLSIKQDGGGCW